MSTEKEIHGHTSEVSEPSVFWFPVYEGLFEHAAIMQDAVWLFMWLIARTTQEGDGKGAVLGGIPITDDRPAAELGVAVKTIRRWRQVLVCAGYVDTIRTPYGFRYTLLKSKKWQKPPQRDLPKRKISKSESAPKGQSDLPRREVRVPDSGRKSARNGKHKEDNIGTTQGQLSGQHTVSAPAFPQGGEIPLPKPTPLRKKPSNRNTNELDYQRPLKTTGVEISGELDRRGETIADYLANWARGRCQAEDYKSREPYADQKKEIEYLTQINELSNYKNIGPLERYCKDRLDSFHRAFATIDYPFAWNNPLLGEEFCQNVEYVVGASQAESPRPKKWELCERVLDRCEKSWSELGEYCDVGLAYCPPDFNEHINRLFRREEG